MPSSPTASTITAPSARTATSSSSSASSTRSTGSTTPIRSIAPTRRPSHEDPRPDRDGAEPRQMHRLPYLLGHLQAGLDLAPGHGIRVVQQCRDQAWRRLSEGLGEPEALERRLDAQEERQDRAEAGRSPGDPRENLRQSESARNRRLLRAFHLRLRTSPDSARAAYCAGGPPAVAGHRAANGQDRMGPELGGDSRRRIRQAVAGLQFRGGAEGYLRPVRKHLHDVSAAALRALPQSELRRFLPLRLDLQA